MWKDSIRDNEMGSRDQLCWYCQNAIGKCSWSHDFTPIPGWTAIPDTVGEKLTYRIYRCPLFKEDNK